MPKYVIHVGPPKTGSKYLQSHLFHARDELRAAGICYPDNWWTRPDDIMHVPLLHDIETRRFREIAAEFAKLNAADHRIVVLSCEGFDALTEDALEHLRDAIGGHPVEIVFYCRAWSQRLPSAWRMRIMTGHFMTFPDFFLFYVGDPAGSGEINHAHVWRKFANVFGKESLKIVSFSNLERHRVDMFEHFCRTFLGLERAPKVDERLIQRNASPGMADIELIRALNYMRSRETGMASSEMRIRFLALRDTLRLDPLLEAMSDSWGSYQIKDLAEPMKLAWKGMEAFSDCLVSKEYGEEFFERGSRLLTYVLPHYLLKESTLEHLRTLYEQVLAQEVNKPELASAPVFARPVSAAR